MGLLVLLLVLLVVLLVVLLMLLMLLMGGCVTGHDELWLDQPLPFSSSFFLLVLVLFFFGPLDVKIGGAWKTERRGERTRGEK